MHDSSAYEVPSTDRISRRRLVVLGATTLTLLLTGACKKGPPESCNDETGLTPDEVAVRKSLEYQDHTPFPDKSCAECAQFVAPASPDQCGACKVMKGPVHPRGYCKVFVKK